MHLFYYNVTTDMPSRHKGISEYQEKRKQQKATAKSEFRKHSYAVLRDTV